MVISQPKGKWVDDISKLILVAGMAHSFEAKGKEEKFPTTISTPVTVDLGAGLFREIIEWKSLPVNSLRVQVCEVQEWEKKIEKLNAIEAISGILNELTAAQIEIFEEAVKRRHLFK